MATLIMRDGTVMKGRPFGAAGDTAGEIVFNTSMAGYQEIITDPSYAGQIIVMTYPEIGNYGVNEDDFEANGPALKALVVKHYCDKESHYKSKIKLGDYLEQKGVIGIQGVDTRALTKKIRECGTMSAFVSSKDLNDKQISEKIGFLQNYKGNPDVVLDVTSKEAYTKGEGDIKLAFIDYGAKSGILRSLLARGCEVTTFPATVAPDEILGKFDAVFLSNGPGDPQDCKVEIETLENLVGKIPIFGICLGYQLLALVLGAKTYKLKYGHRGSNHPVIDLKTNRVMMSAQNHGYAVDENSLTKLMTSTYKNLNDGTLEGFEAEALQIYAVQFHPEAAPGPGEADNIFDTWVLRMREYSAAKV